MAAHRGRDTMEGFGLLLTSFLIGLSLADGKHAFFELLVALVSDLAAGVVTIIVRITTWLRSYISNENY